MALTRQPCAEAIGRTQATAVPPFPTGACRQTLAATARLSCQWMLVLCASGLSFARPALKTDGGGR